MSKDYYNFKNKKVIYPQKYNVKKHLKAKYSSVVEETEKVSDDSILGYHFSPKKYYSERLDDFNSCLNFCLSCNLLTFKETKEIQRHVELKNNFNQKFVKEKTE